MQKKPLFLLVAFLLISIMIGGCTTMQSTTVITPKVDAYPKKSITLIVPFTAGSTLDMVARLMEKFAPKYLGQSLVIINKPGGAGTVGWNELASTEADGYTIGMTGLEIILDPLYSSGKYNYITDLTPLAQISSSPMVMATLNTQPWKTVDELVSYAKQHPGQIKFGHWGVGSQGHILGEIFAKEAGIDIEQVPFRGGTESIAALLGGHVQLIFCNPVLVREQVKSGAVRVLAVTSDHRLNDSFFSNTPTFKESGLNVIGDYWYGIGAPKELPIEAKNKLEEGFRKLITDPEFKNDMENIGAHVEYLDSEESQIKWITEDRELAKNLQETDILDLIKAQKQ